MNKFLLITTAAAALMLTACDQNATNPEQEGAKIRILPELQAPETKVTDTAFEDGDQIGISILAGAETFADNECLTYTGNVFSGELNWYNDSEAASDILAYYPYDADGTPSTFTVQTDQSAGVSSSDFIFGSKTGVTPSEDAISMTFKHALSKLLVNMTNDAGSDITAVTFKGSKTTADILLASTTASASASSAAADIKAFESEKNKTYCAILVPQSVSLTMEVTTADGNSYSQELETTELLQGAQYRITARISSSAGLQVKVAGAIEDWTDEGEIGPKPEDNELVYGGVTYKTVTLSNGQTWMAEPLRYVPEGMTVSSDPADDNAHIWYPYEVVDGTASALTDEASIAAKGYLYDMCAALGVDEITADNCKSFEGAQGICPDGWHIPTWKEYYDLVGKSNAVDGIDGSNVSNTNAIFYDSDCDGAKIADLNEAGWNYTFSGVRQKSGFSATGTYSKLVIDDSVCSVEEYMGENRMSYTMTSTCHKANYSSSDPTVLNSIQFMGLMSTFTKSYMEGRLTLSFMHYESGMELRCVKDAE